METAMLLSIICCAYCIAFALQRGLCIVYM